MKLQPTSKQEYFDQALAILGPDRMQATLNMTVKDLHITFSVAYQQFNHEIEVAIKGLITARISGLSILAAVIDPNGRIQQLRDKNMRAWPPEELNEWFVEWKNVTGGGERNAK